MVLFWGFYVVLSAFPATAPCPPPPVWLVGRQTILSLLGATGVCWPALCSFPSLEPLPFMHEQVSSQPKSHTEPSAHLNSSFFVQLLPLWYCAPPILSFVVYLNGDLCFSLGTLLDSVLLPQNYLQEISWWMWRSHCLFSFSPRSQSYNAFF